MPSAAAGRWAVLWMVKLAVVQTGIYRGLERQCVAHAPRFSTCARDECAGSALQKVVRLRRLAAHLNTFSFCIFCLALLKYAALELFKFDQLHAYRWLDCCILGRFRFFGRTSKMSNLVLMQFIVVYSLYRYFVVQIAPGRFKFHALEFLLTDREQVLEKARQLRVCGAACRLDAPDLNFYLESAFEVGNQHGVDTEWLLRPNRTAGCWLILSLFTRAVFVLFVASQIFWVAIITYIIGGSVVSKTGFELAYGPGCLTWVRDEQRRQVRRLGAATGNVTLSYSSIYRPGHVLASEMSVDSVAAILPLGGDWPELNAYNSARITMDMLENLFWYAELISYFFSVLYVSFIAAVDIGLNANRVKLLLKAAIRQMGAAPSDQRPPEPGPFWDEFCPAGPAHGHHQRPTSLEISRLQAILADHLKLIRSFNSYLSCLAACLAAIWLLSTIVICVWMVNVKSRNLELEFFLSNCGSSVILIAFLSLAAFVRSRTGQLYPLIASLMARDQHPSTKRRWITIVKYFYPKPMYCFTILESLELSWLFVLKLYAWIISAFVVLANFFYRTVD